MTGKKIMRDAFLERLHALMREDDSIFLLSADFGSPMLDPIRRDFKDRFVNVGIAEQNLINLSAGLALEGFKVYAYAIAPFLTMRACEQIRVNLALLGQLREINVNLVGVGAGLSYDVSGPTHHCFEDIAIMRAFPDITILSPSDGELAVHFCGYAARTAGVKYIRLDGKAVRSIDSGPPIFEAGFRELKKGGDALFISTGYMTHAALEASEILEREGIGTGVVDLFMLPPFDCEGLMRALAGYKRVITVEEGFAGRGGLDSIISYILAKAGSGVMLSRVGFGGAYVFETAGRDTLHRLYGLDPDSIAGAVRRAVQGA